MRVASRTTHNGIPQASLRRLRELVDEFPSKRIVVCGDLMLDHYIRGRVSRISPEAPVPVVQVRSESHVPGGAGNVCSNIASLSASVSVVGVLGADAAGQTLLDDLRSRGIQTAGALQDGERATTQKVRVIGEHQQLLRYDRETSDGLSRRLQARLVEALEEAAGRAHGIVISDYGKGVVTPELLKAALRAARRRRIPITVDPKIEHFMRYRGVDCITPNLNEAWAGMRLLPREDEAAVLSLGGRILTTLRARSVLITRGEKGMTLFESRGGRPQAPAHIPARAKEVFDVTGAGDTVISVLALGLACRASLREASLLSNHAAGIVVGKLGTATVSVPELKGALS
ncbi:MAG: D-glycero-beta-D-manno-heptose-7-phosphate kinase [Elusimicrobia bacterium]|nr:D-glycero-beta-D-manno-heptose-7-phosphate kinase [Elusimicrobiota bacterium]